MKASWEGPWAVFPEHCLIEFSGSSPGARRVVVIPILQMRKQRLPEFDQLDQCAGSANMRQGGGLNPHWPSSRGCCSLANVPYRWGVRAHHDVKSPSKTCKPKMSPRSFKVFLTQKGNFPMSDWFWEYFAPFGFWPCLWESCDAHGKGPCHGGDRLPHSARARCASQWHLMRSKTWECIQHYMLCSRFTAIYLLFLRIIT